MTEPRRPDAAPPQSVDSGGRGPASASSTLPHRHVETSDLNRASNGVAGCGHREHDSHLACRRHNHGAAPRQVVTVRSVPEGMSSPEAAGSSSTATVQAPSSRKDLGNRSHAARSRPTAIAIDPTNPQHNPDPRHQNPITGDFELAPAPPYAR